VSCEKTGARRWEMKDRRQKERKNRKTELGDGKKRQKWREQRKETRDKKL